MQNWVSSSPIRPISNQLYLIYTFLDVGPCADISYIFSIWTGTSIPKSGADYAYIGEAFGSLPSFLYLWDAIFIFVPTTNAIMGLTVANYMAKPLFPDCDPPDEALRLIAAVSETILKNIFVSEFPLWSDLHHWLNMVELLQHQGHDQATEPFHGDSI